MPRSAGPLDTLAERPQRQEPPPPQEESGRVSMRNTMMTSPDDYEFVCYGDRVAFLCEGQLLALTRKFNLTYNQMAALMFSTICSGGLLGIAGFFVWKKGLFRKRYAALFSDEIYAADEDEIGCGGDEAGAPDCDEKKKKKKKPGYGFIKPPCNHYTEELSRSEMIGKGDEQNPIERESGHEAVTFRLFEFDEQKQAIVFSSVGKPVRFGTPLVVVHAATGRAIKYQSHRGAVTISKPPKNLNFHKQVRADLFAMNGSSTSSVASSTARWSSVGVPQPRSRPHSSIDPTSIEQEHMRHQRERSSQHSTPLPNLNADYRPPERALTHRRGSTTYRTMDPGISVPLLQDDHHNQDGDHHRHRPFIRSISESYITFVSDISESLHRQRERHDLKRRQKQLMKDLPNMSFTNKSGKYFVAMLRQVNPSSANTSDYRIQVTPHEQEEFLRWGAPMALVAQFNNQPCGIRPREYYKDSQLYLTTEATQTTIIPLREDGDLRCMAKESTRYLAHIERRQVHVSVGTYNVWMMPRKVSAFTSVSPRKNTRARLIADVLPSCDVWVLTECFDHRARNILLDKLKDAGYYFISPTVGHKRMNRGNMRKMLNGGVVVVSKYPIMSVRIKLFNAASAGADKLADKGILYCKILKDGLLVHIFATHLQAWDDVLSRSIRRTQMKMIKEFMRSMSIDEENDAVLYVGDLNVNYWLNKTNSEYDEMLEIFNAKDPSLVRSHRGQTATNLSESLDLKRSSKYSFDPRVNVLAADGLSTDGSLELLDYVLYSAAHRQPSKAKSWIQPLRSSTPWNWRKQPEYNLSDHFPVMSSFTFDM